MGLLSLRNAAPRAVGTAHAVLRMLCVRCALAPKRTHQAGPNSQVGGVQLGCSCQIAWIYVAELFWLQDHRLRSLPRAATSIPRPCPQLPVCSMQHPREYTRSTLRSLGYQFSMLGKEAAPMTCPASSGTPTEAACVGGRWQVRGGNGRHEAAAMAGATAAAAAGVVAPALLSPRLGGCSGGRVWLPYPTHQADPVRFQHFGGQQSGQVGREEWG